jgi:membrane-bound lytic murein transglycosylase MltF
VTAQVEVESAGDPNAKSPAGAMGLLQLMPATAAEVGVQDPFEPQQNLMGGVSYLRQQYDRLEEIPEHHDRLFWAFAAYNGGRGYVNKALAAARRDIRDWHRWEPGRFWLMHRNCVVDGRWPDYKSMWLYVEAIRRRFHLSWQAPDPRGASDGTLA